MKYSRYVLCVTALLVPSNVWAWGCSGHQIVALIAEAHLDDHAHVMVDQLLRDNPIDPTLARFCKPLNPDPMADAATWADDYRAGHPETAPWHFIDIPLGTKSKRVDKYCLRPGGCITTALDDQLKTLRDASADPRTRADALRFIIHFVGDIQQPMHAVTNNDLGGNCVPVSYFDQEAVIRDPQKENSTPNLHGVWDTNMIEHMMNEKSVETFATELDREFHPQMRSLKRSGMKFDTWARESYRLAGQMAYRDLPIKINPERPQPTNSCADDNHVGTRMFGLHEHLADQYQNAAEPIIADQLAKAGMRLAIVLNQIWP
jgi:hypothetical protein